MRFLRRRPPRAPGGTCAAREERAYLLLEEARLLCERLHAHCNEDDAHLISALHRQLGLARYFASSIACDAVGDALGIEVLSDHMHLAHIHVLSAQELLRAAQREELRRGASARRGGTLPSPATVADSRDNGLRAPRE